MSKILYQIKYKSEKLVEKRHLLCLLCLNDKKKDFREDTDKKNNKKNCVNRCCYKMNC